MYEVLEHIKTFIPRRGYADYSWDYKYVIVDELTRVVHLSLQNEFLYLIPKKVKEGIIIISDTEYIITNEISTADPNVLIKPLTGNITIISQADIREVLSFIHVIPQ